MSNYKAMPYTAPWRSKWLPCEN